MASTNRDNRELIINNFQSDLQKFQRDIGNVAGSNNFFSVISQLRTLEISKLEKMRLDLFSKNINSALNKFSLKINEVKEKLGDISESEKILNENKRYHNDIKDDNQLNYDEKINQFHDIFNKIIEGINNLNDTSESLIRKGKYKFLFVYGSFATIFATLFGIVVAFLSNWDPSIVKEDLLVFLILLALSLVLLWNVISTYLTKKSN